MGSTSTFENKQELIARLGVTVIPSEDLKTRRISFRLNLNDGLKKGVENSLAKVTFGGEGGTRTLTPFGTRS